MGGHHNERARCLAEISKKADRINSPRCGLHPRPSGVRYREVRKLFSIRPLNAKTYYINFHCGSECARFGNIDRVYLEFMSHSAANNYLRDVLSCRKEGFGRSMANGWGTETFAV